MSFSPKILPNKVKDFPSFNFFLSLLTPYQSLKRISIIWFGLDIGANN
jgi:hypothetical protein